MNTMGTVVYSLFEFPLNRPTDVYTETQALCSMYASCNDLEAPTVQITDKSKHKQLYIWIRDNNVSGNIPLSHYAILAKSASGRKMTWQRGRDQRVPWI